MPKVSYRPAPEVAQVAQEIIREHRRMLINADICYLFCDVPEKVKGRDALGTARIVSGLNAYFIQSYAEQIDNDDDEYELPGQLFVITIFGEAWNEILSERQKRALVHHELCHCNIDINDKGEEVYSLVGHDVEEFNEIAKIHGPWSLQLAAIMAALKKGPQMTFEEIAEVPPGAAMKMPDVGSRQKVEVA